TSWPRDWSSDVCSSDLDVGHGRSRRNHHRQIYRFRYFGNPPIGFDSQNAGPLVAYRINGSAKRTAHQAPQHSTPDAAHALRGPNHGDAMGSENRIRSEERRGGKG